MAKRTEQTDINAELMAKLRKCIDRDNGGFANPDALRAVKSILQSIGMQCHPSSYAREKMVEIETWASIYFSARKNEKYSGGARQVYVWLLGDLDSLERALKRGIGKLAD